MRESKKGVAEWREGCPRSCTREDAEGGEEGQTESGKGWAAAGSRQAADRRQKTKDKKPMEG
jgi:hypothetical protein